jgi:tyrosyl-tRNA synthetase
MKENFFEILKSRGFIEQATGENIADIFSRDAVTFYAGFDPTADSFHLGHLIPLLILIHGQRCGHNPVLLMGGATGMIGDPSGKSHERNLLSVDEIKSNQASIKKQLSRFVAFEGKNNVRMMNNFDWIEKISYIDWLRDVGKHFTISNMLCKESVRKRMENENCGLSYTEFSYQLLQAYDFLHLYKKTGCTVQAGGSDQWGNITAGIDLIRRKTGAQTYGFTAPLLTSSSGAKFGKSEGNAVWLDSKKTSIWDFYQYWINTSDEDVIRYLKLFTFIDLEEVDALEKDLKQNPSARKAQKKLAFEVTAYIHSKDEAVNNEKAAISLFSGRLAECSVDKIKDVLGAGNAHRINPTSLKKGYPIIKLVTESKLTKSNSEAKRKLKEGAIYLNDKRVSDDILVTEKQLLKNNILLLRMGKKKYALVEVGE